MGLEHRRHAGFDGGADLLLGVKVFGPGFNLL
jgi:hypothetical protein